MSITYPALGGQRPMDISEFEASLVYKVSSRTARVHRETPKQNKSRHLRVFSQPSLTYTVL